MNEENNKTVVKKGKKWGLKLAAVAIVAAAIAGAVFGLSNAKNTQGENTGTPSQPPIVTPTENQSKAEIINKAVCENTNYDNFDYKYTTYTQVDGKTVVQVNGTTTKDGVTTYSKLSYEVDETLYQSFIGYELNVSKSDDGKFLFENSGSTKTEEENILIGCMLESITERTPSAIQEMTYEQNLESVVNYLKKKSGLVLCDGLELKKQDNVSQTYGINMYVDVSGENESGVSDVYSIRVKQSKDSMAQAIDQETGKIIYSINPNNVYFISAIFEKERNKELSPEDYLNSYIDFKGDNSQIYNSILSCQDVKNKLYVNYGTRITEYEMER